MSSEFSHLNNLILTSLILQPVLFLQGSSESDNSLDFSPFNYLLLSSNAASDPTLHEENQVFLGHGEELIPLPLDEKMLDKSMSSDVEGALSSSISSGDSSQYG